MRAVGPVLGECRRGWLSGPKKYAGVVFPLGFDRGAFNLAPRAQHPERNTF